MSGRALVTDADGHVRALTVLAGTEDHTREERYLYDEHGKLRVLFIIYQDVHGTAYSELLAFDESRQLEACEFATEAIASAVIDLCSDDRESVPELEPEVEAILAEPPNYPRPTQELRDRFHALDPKLAFDACEPD